MLKHGMVMYDALYTWCRTLQAETHNWPSTKPVQQAGCLLYRLCRGPIVRLGLQSAAPGVERVVHDHPVLQHFMVIREVSRKAERNCKQAAALRGQIVPRCIGAPDNRRQVVESRVLDVVDAQDRIERTALALVRELDAIDIVGNPASLFGDGENLFRRDVNEFRPRVDETVDQPGARDTIDLRVLARHPLVGCRNSVTARRQGLVIPAANAAFKVCGFESSRSQRTRYVLADLAPMSAVHDHRASTGQIPPPSLDLIWGIVKGRHNKRIRLREVGRPPNVDDDRR